MPNTHVRAAAEGMPKIKTPHPGTDLSFMRVLEPEGTGINYWTVESAGSLTADWKKGNELGREYLDYIGHHPTNGNATLLGCIVNDMMVQRSGAGKLSGVELGFLQEVNRYAMAAMKVVVQTMGKAEGGDA